MTYRIYAEDGAHCTAIGEDYATLEEGRAAFKEMIPTVRQQNLESNEEEEGFEWFTFYIQLLEVDEDGDEDWEPIEEHVFAEDENPLPKLVKQWATMS